MTYEREVPRLLSRTSCLTALSSKSMSTMNEEGKDCPPWKALLRISSTKFHHGVFCFVFNMRCDVAKVSARAHFL